MRLSVVAVGEVVAPVLWIWPAWVPVVVGYRQVVVVLAECKRVVVRKKPAVVVHKNPAVVVHKSPAVVHRKIAIVVHRRLSADEG